MSESPGTGLTHTASMSDPFARAHIWSIVPLPFVVPIVLPTFLSFLSIESDPSATQGLLMSLATLSAVAAWWWLVVVRPNRRSTPQAPRQDWTCTVRLALLSCLCVFVLKMAVSNGLSGALEGRRSSGASAASPVTWALASMFLNNVLVNPIMEEIVFRGMVFRKLRLYWGATPAAIVTTLVFGAIHAGSFNSTLAGLSLVLLYAHTKTLWAPILAHCLNNFIVFLWTCGQLSLGRDPLVYLWSLLDRWSWGVAATVVTLSLIWFTRFVRSSWPSLSKAFLYEPHKA